MTMMAVNINCKKYDFISWILDGSKTMETRKNHSLRCYVGQRVGLCMTGRGKALLVGYATIKKEILISNGIVFESMENLHKVTKENSYFKDGISYGYMLENVVEITPIPLDSKGIISRVCPEEINLERYKRYENRFKF